MTHFSKSRRHVLGGIAGSAAAALAAPAALRAQPATVPAMQLAHYYSNRHSAAQVGRQYLKGSPAQTCATVVSELLGSRELPFSSRTDLDAFIKGKVRADFAAGRVVRVQRWLLSRTEAQLCALAALV